MAITIKLLHSINGVRLEEHTNDDASFVRYIVSYPDKRGYTTHKVYTMQKEAENKYKKLTGAT